MDEKNAFTELKEFLYKSNKTIAENCSIIQALYYWNKVEVNSTSPDGLIAILNLHSTSIIAFFTQSPKSKTEWFCSRATLINDKCDIAYRGNAVHLVASELATSNVCDLWFNLAQNRLAVTLVNNFIRCQLQYLRKASLPNEAELVSVRRVLWPQGLLPTPLCDDFVDIETLSGLVIEDDDECVETVASLMSQTAGVPPFFVNHHIHKARNSTSNMWHLFKSSSPPPYPHPRKSISKVADIGNVGSQGNLSSGVHLSSGRQSPTQNSSVTYYRSMMNGLDNLTGGMATSSGTVGIEEDADFADGTRVDTRPIIQDLMVQRENEYCSYQKYRVFVGSWNVNGRFDEHSPIDEWLQKGVVRKHSTSGSASTPTDSAPVPASTMEWPDLYVLGFQEFDLTIHGVALNKSTSSLVEERWLTLIESSETFRQVRYKRLQRCRLAAIFLVIYVRETRWAHVRSGATVTSVLPTGMFNVWGNKGATAISVQLHDARLCFVNVHLAAGESNLFRRNQDFKTILSQLVFDYNLRAWRIEEHDLVFFFGDMNYRISQLDADTVRGLITSRQFEYLLGYDELFHFRMVKGFEEGAIEFAPTYKFDPNSNVYDTSEKNRVPSYCDRILYKSEHPEHIQNVLYTSCHSLLISDHKPVVGIYNVAVRHIDVKAQRKTYESVIRQIDLDQNALLPQAKLNTQDLDFGEVRMLEAKQAALVITNVGQYPFSIDFKSNADGVPPLPEWITFVGSRRVAPGESVTLQFEVYVNPKFVSKFHTGEYTCETILILTLLRGKHFFITTHGRFIPTSFGLPLTVLLTINTPLANVEEVVLKAKIAEAKSHKWRGGDPSVLKDDGAEFVVPKEIHRLTQHLYNVGLQQAELMRQPGIHAEMQVLRTVLDTGTVSEPLPSNISIHSVMECLMTFLECLYLPVIPKEFCEACLANVRDPNVTSDALQRLPADHLNLFVHINAFLREIVKNSAVNGVQTKILAEMFGEIVFRDVPNRMNRMPEIRQFMLHFIT